VVARFDDWLSERGLALEVRTDPAGTRTAEDAARAIGCEVGQIVKSLVFTAGGRPLVALVSGASRLDPRRLETLAGGESRRAHPGRSASSEQGDGPLAPRGHRRPLYRPPT
jgi:prolyl-tRNA editing enzyme YbaK/EbsC (Cys-tRNA(Pro) deacylase)